MISVEGEVNFMERARSTILTGWLVMLILLLPAYLSADNYSVTNYTIRDGLPGMSIRSIYKDSRGLLWIGTSAGLCSFDGKSFRVWSSADGMSASQVWSIVEDGKGNMWFGSFGEGLFRFDGTQFKQYTTYDGLVDNRIRVLRYSVKYDCVVAGSYDGINIISPDTLFRFEERTPGKSYGTITGMADAEDFIYITTYGSFGILKYDYAGTQIYPMHNEKPDNSQNSYAAYISSKGDTLFSYSWGVGYLSQQKMGIVISQGDQSIVKDSLGQIFGIDEDSRGHIWLAGWSYFDRDMEGGIFRYDGNEFKNFKQSFGIDDRQIWSVLCDREQDILWIGTIAQGLFRVPLPLIPSYTPEMLSMKDQKINDLFMDSKNRLWISGSQELIRLESTGQTVHIDKLRMANAFWEYWSGTDHRHIPPSNPMFTGLLSQDYAYNPGLVKQAQFDFGAIEEDTDSSFLITCSLGLFHYHEPDQRFKYLGPEGYLKNIAVMSDTLYISGSEDSRYNPDFRNSRQWKDNSLFYQNSIFRRLTEEGNPMNVNRMVRDGNRLWFSSWTSGLWILEGNNLINFNKQDSSISINLTDMGIDSKGNIFFGSATGELIMGRYQNRELEIIHRIGKENGLQGISIRWLVIGNDDRVWVGTNEGLNVVSPDDIVFGSPGGVKFYGEEEGFTAQLSSRAVMDKNGILWINDTEKLVSIKIADLDSVKFRPGDIRLQNLEINNQPSAILKGFASVSGINELGKVKLKYTENNLIFHYDVINFRNPDIDIFRFKLEGYDEKWTDWSDRRRAGFTNLSPGHYTLRIESFNLMADCYAEPFQIDFTICHPWWGLWYVQTGGLLILLLLLLLWLRWYIGTERKKQQIKWEIEKKIILLEMQALQAQMNPHFIFNCINGIQYYVMTKSIDEVLVYLSDFSRVVRESLENATQKMVLLSQEFGFLNSYLRLEQMRFPEKFDYRIECENGLEMGVVMIPPMLVQPFAENSIRHGFSLLERKGLLSIVFEPAGKGMLKCTITDNGVGRAKAGQSSGAIGFSGRPHSTTIIDTRLKLFNTPVHPDRYRLVYTDLFDKDVPSGLRVELYMPAGCFTG